MRGKIFGLLAALLALPASALAAQTPETTSGGQGLLGEKKLETVGKISYGAATQRPIEDVIAGLIQTFLGIVGVIFLALMIYGGYLWMNARGEEQEVEKAKDTIKAAVIGLAVVIGAYAITNFVVTYLVKSVGSTI